MQLLLLWCRLQVAPRWTATLDGPCRGVPGPGDSRGEARGAVAVENKHGHSTTLAGLHQADRTPSSSWTLRLMTSFAASSTATANATASTGLDTAVAPVATA